MKRILLYGLPLLAGISSLFAEQTNEIKPEPAAPKIQIAILLDTSNSMDGLINQARSHLWSIVNEFAKAKREGRQAEFEVALYEYGNDGISGKKHHVRQITPLTTDLDKVSEALFALKTNGGEEYCGAAIQDAITNLAWSTSNDDFKAIYIAGNEPFTQGPIQYGKACKASIEKGIIINTIHCGGDKEGVEGKWKDGAKLADGAFVTIDQNAVAEQIDAPQDPKIAELNNKLNATYVAFGGAKAESAKMRQLNQDATAQAAAPNSATNRAIVKSKGTYKNSEWDLVDANKEGKLDLEKVPEAQLPAELKGKTTEEKQKYVEGLEKTRVEIQAEIGKLAKDREKFLTEERKRRAADAGVTLESAVTQSVNKQITEKGFVLEQ